VLENLQAEAHLVGNREFGDPLELAAFLRRCAARFTAASDPAEQHRCYEEACKEFSGRGLRVLREHLPERLLRYSTSRTLLGLLAEQLVGEPASIDLRLGFLSPEKACDLLAAAWDSSRLSKGELGVTPQVFATFEHPGATSRDDALAMSQALALPFWERPRTSEEILFELAYPTDSVDGPRFPTVAEAGWSSLFQPAEELPPETEEPRSCCGWTRPLGPHSAQPEIVHDNASVAVMSSSPRWIGRIPV